MLLGVCVVFVLLAAANVPCEARGECEPKLTCNITEEFEDLDACECKQLSHCVGFEVEEFSPTKTSDRECTDPLLVECVVQHAARDVALELRVSEVRPITLSGIVNPEDQTRPIELFDEERRLRLIYLKKNETWLLQNAGEDILRWDGVFITDDKGEEELVWIDQLQAPPVLISSNAKKPSVTILCFAVALSHELTDGQLATALVMPVLFVPFTLLFAAYHLHQQGWHLDLSDDAYSDESGDDWDVATYSKLRSQQSDIIDPEPGHAEDDSYGEEQRGGDMANNYEFLASSQ